MDKKLPIKKTRTLNPLWIICLFVLFSESALCIAVVKTSGTIQIVLAIFAIIFPVYVASFFFYVLLKKPKNLYSPRDYRSDESFLRSFEEIEEEDESAQESFNEQPLQITNGRDNSNSGNPVGDKTVNIDLSEFGKMKTLSIPYDKLKNLTELTNIIYFQIKSQVNPFTYGYTWVLRDKDSGKVIRNARMLRKRGPGEMISDTQTLEEAGIYPGINLIVQKIES